MNQWMFILEFVVIATALKGLLVFFVGYFEMILRLKIFRSGAC